MSNPIVIRFPYWARLVEPTFAVPTFAPRPTDAEYQARFDAGVARRIANKVYDMPVPMWCRKQA